MPAAASNLDRTICELGLEDIERIAAIDRALSGRSRRRFYETRLAAARERPEEFIHIGAMRGGVLLGFVFARILSGEFGHAQSVAMLDAIGVEPHSQRLGVGQELMEDLVRRARARGVKTLQSQANWTSHSLLRFFEMSHFHLAARSALDRSVARPLVEAGEEV